MLKQAGFTLVEMVLTITIVAILAAIAAPSFSSFIVSQRIKTASFDVIASLSLARSEAMKSNGAITITPVGGNWASGWEITRPDASVIKTQGAVARVSISGPANIVFGRSGRITSASGTLQLDAISGVGAVTKRCISIDTTGVPRSKIGTCS